MPFSVLIRTINSIDRCFSHCVPMDSQRFCRCY